MKICRKCNLEFSAWKEIDGKKRNLSNRKLCLTCSPFGLHNTKKDPEQPNKKYDKNGKPTEKYKHNTRKTNYLRQWKRRKQLIEMSGGKCRICGYDKCSSALHFHHRDRKDKKFGLCVANLSSKNWNDILNEWEKCDLVCSNCHCEIEEEILSSKDSRYQKMKREFFSKLEVKTNYDIPTKSKRDSAGNAENT